ncbi:MAG: mobile mystery protein B [Steroidobacteraceae bacterium]
MTLADPPAATPLDPDEAKGLLPRHISTQGQLNEWEHQNILEGQEWAFSRRRKNLLTTGFMKSLHKRMFGNTWQWAGTLRTSEKNIGVAPEYIAIRLKELCDDVAAQLENRSFPIREIAARFHHRLVYIHPFPNGNGRFARVMADLLLVENGERPFTWGEGDLVADGAVRDRYIAALREADGRNYQPLFEFVRTQAG